MRTSILAQKELSKVLRILIIALILALSSAPIQVKQEPSHVVAIDLKSLVPRPVVARKQVSRSSQQIERRAMTITAYTKDDEGMNGRGITTSGERVRQGLTIAAPERIPFGTEIHIPVLGTFVVSDRGGAIKGNRLDLYMERREDALRFGVQRLEVFIKYP
ncbi:3D domain-containing protein [Desulfosporosinus nitroreducens]|uniref:3D domain-containing protein n=1 Tax=Desulfosporosinus nitroreducens TaxID=2018668 RepID=UPI00207CC0D1|nr:3D domain-containing protein [Desulfosporosinus nitroreducens]MCO1599862.1 3D domain-containing protein [Desulfosporosinus nitroreducens]